MLKNLGEIARANIKGALANLLNNSKENREEIEPLIHNDEINPAPFNESVTSKATLANSSEEIKQLIPNDEKVTIKAALVEVLNGSKENREEIKRLIRSGKINLELFNEIGAEKLSKVFSKGYFQGMNLLGVLLTQGYGDSSSYGDKFSLVEAELFAQRQRQDLIQFITHLSAQQRFVLLSTVSLDPKNSHCNESLIYSFTLNPEYNKASIYEWTKDFTIEQRLTILETIPQKLIIKWYDNTLFKDIFVKNLSKKEVEENIIRIKKTYSDHPDIIEPVLLQLLRFINSDQWSENMTLLINALSFKQFMERLSQLPSTHQDNFYALINAKKSLLIEQIFEQYDYQELLDYYKQSDVNSKEYSLVNYLCFKKVALIISSKHIFTTREQHEIEKFLSDLMSFYSQIQPTFALIQDAHTKLGILINKISNFNVAKTFFENHLTKTRNQVFLDIKNNSPDNALRSYAHYLQIKGTGGDNEEQIRSLAIGYSQALEKQLNNKSGSHTAYRTSSPLFFEPQEKMSILKEEITLQGLTPEQNEEIIQNSQLSQ
ncbi:hypothetical protein [Legionella fairfieldensis]|uniref:hypothetical protein n=1 Tax=Legionella fairfieldensis TaxID=45064 RepID=UPI00048EFB31|nr:hypothetical protein [Legionella fairfieldensis]